MAQQKNQVNQDKFCCSICLDLLKDPVTIPCGHSYCMNCIKTFWDEEDQKGTHSCPQCRETFTPRPVLMKNMVFADLLEELKKTGLQAAPADHCYAGPEDVACDFCSGRKLKAFKSCSVCLASYCEKHLQPHYDVAPLKKHKLVQPSKNLQENICSRHDEVMKMFCRTDQKCICYLCSVDEHKGHNMVSAAAERIERQKKLEVRRKKIQQGIQDREKEVTMCQEKVDSINHSADKSVEVFEKIFTDLIHLIQKRFSEVKQYLLSKQKSEVIETKNIQKKLEQEITELLSEDVELNQLSNTEEDILFLNNYPLKFLSPSVTWPRLKMPEPFYWSLEDVKRAVSEAERTVQEIVTDRWLKISLTDTELDVSPSNTTNELKTRDTLLKYSQNLSLDSSTANMYLSVQRNKAIKMEQKQYSSDNPKRFYRRCQVLSRESLNDCSYWEVEMRGGRVSVAVAYEDISRDETYKNYKFGYNENSWALECSPVMIIFRHDKALTFISGPGSSRIGVYLDHRAGILSFYSVSEETATLLHRVQTTFTQPLHAGLGLFETGDEAEICRKRFEFETLSLFKQKSIF